MSIIFTKNLHTSYLYYIIKFPNNDLNTSETFQTIDSINEYRIIFVKIAHTVCFGYAGFIKNYKVGANNIINLANLPSNFRPSFLNTYRGSVTFYADNKPTETNYYIMSLTGGNLTVYCKIAGTVAQLDIFGSYNV